MSLSPKPLQRHSLNIAARACLALGLAMQLQWAAAQNVNLDIAEQPLAHALDQLAQQSGLQLVYPPDAVQGRSAPAIKGQHTIEEGLQLLLKGSGLQGRVVGDTVTVTLPSTKASSHDTDLAEVVVSAGDQSVHALPAPAVGGQVAEGVRLGVLGNTSHFNAPFSTTSYTAEAVANQQAPSIADAINRDPSVRYTVLPGGNVDNLFIRGFPIWEGNSGEIALDGIYGVAPNYRVRSEYVDRIEVVKGPGALLFGMSPNGSVGGVINIAPKRASGDTARLTTSYTSDSLLRAHADVGRRFGEQAQWGIRVNGSTYSGDTAMDHQSMTGNVLAMALDYETERFRATLDLLSQNEKIKGVGRPIMPSGLDAMPSAPDGRNNVTQPWEWSENKERAALLRTEWDVTQQLAVFANVGTSTADVSRVYDSAPRLVSESGATNITPTYAIFDVDRKTIDAGLRSRFETGPIRHSVTLQTAVYEENFKRVLAAGSPVSSNIYAPISYPEQNLARPGQVPRIHENRNTGVALVDTMTMLDDRLQVSLGLRRQRVKSTNFNLLSGAPSNVYDQTVTTPAIGVVFWPQPQWSIYANHIEGLSKGDIAPPSASNYGEVLAPYTSKQYEIGTKYDFGNMVATAALFQIDKPSAGLQEGRYITNGEQRNRGLELYAYGEPWNGLRVLGGVTWMRSEFTKSATAALVGRQPIGAPRQLANLGLEWDLPALPNLTLVGDWTYTGKQYVNQTNTLHIAAWNRFDLGMRLRTEVMGKPTTLRASVQNVTNRNAWVGVTSWGAVSQQMPRTLMLSASVDF
ncbi:TonB-dependent receptor [Lampropedia puyangensis]|uniref:TonB-dependent receptor n=1 Tax=Lampropedia puyangensis TaxID=1330072 RepID=A0A4S8FBP4_9BURK|nr:TonB-dependent receptor [Lampropedia puyangensis]THU05073.1 TonB-dependent receptor [Lampropedia puyangensis]